MPDFLLADHGSVLVLNANTEPAKEWVREHLPADAQRWGRGTVIEPRYWPPIEEGIAAEGLTLIVH